MFSPTLPSPRVAATTSLPAVYLRESERPSIFNSQMYSGFGMTLRTRYRVLEFLTHDKGDHTPHLQPMAYPRYSIRERTYLITPLNL